MAWRSGQSYSADLRGRVLAAVDSGKAVGAVAARFGVSVSYIWRCQIGHGRSDVAGWRA
jgi:transposase-like protein